MNFTPNIWILLQTEGFLFQSDKIYSVLVIILSIFVAIIIHMIRTDLKLRALEEKCDEVERGDM